MNIIEYIVIKVYQGYNNNFDLEKKFRNDLEEKLKNEPNKSEFLESLKQAIILENDKHLVECKEKNCNYFLLRESSIKIINALLNEIKENEKPVINISDNSINKNIINNSSDININQNTSSELKENWFKKNVKYFYYTGGSIALIYGFYKWVLPLLFP